VKGSAAAQARVPSTQVVVLLVERMVPEYGF